MLTKEGANAFLKTLEEPPPHAVFILATTEPEKLPVTILSRCQRYAFRRISIPVMIEKMKEVARGENIAIDDEALKAIAYRADGGLRDALTMLEQLAAFSAGQTATTGTLDLAFGATGREFAATLVDAIVAGDATAALGAVEAASDAGADLTVLTRLLIAAFRHLLVARVDADLLATRPGSRRRAARRTPGGEPIASDAVARAANVRRSALARALGRQRAPRTRNGAPALHFGRRRSDARCARRPPRDVGGTPGSLHQPRNALRLGAREQSPPSSDRDGRGSGKGRQPPPSTRRRFPYRK